MLEDSQTSRPTSSPDLVTGSAETLAEHGDLDKAIIRVEESRQTHIEWLSYWQELENHVCTSEPCPWEQIREATAAVAGDAEHQRECIKGYDNVLAVLHGVAALGASGVVRPAAEVRAEALREAADAWDDRSEENLHRLSAMALERYKAGGPSMPAIWLRDRAALAEEGER
jgi:hypothetical protein